MSGYFHDWATWTLGTGEADTTTTLAEEEEVGEAGEEDLWTTWDKILVKWNSGVLTKTADVKVQLIKSLHYSLFSYHLMLCR